MGFHKQQQLSRASSWQRPSTRSRTLTAEIPLDWIPLCQIIAASKTPSAKGVCRVAPVRRNRHGQRVWRAQITHPSTKPWSEQLPSLRRAANYQRYLRSLPPRPPLTDVPARGFDLHAGVVALLPKLRRKARAHAEHPARQMDRDDLVQSSVVQIIGSFPTFEGRNGASFETWALAVAENHMKSYFRQRRDALTRRNQLVRPDGADPDDVDNPSRGWDGIDTSREGDRFCNPLDVLIDGEERAERRERVAALILTVDQHRDRQLLDEVYVQSKSYSDLSQALQVPSAALRQRVSRACRSIETSLVQDGLIASSDL